MQSTVNVNRELWIGGSDIPAIMGISPFTTRYDLLLFKAGIKKNDFEGNEYTKYGNIMEDKIRKYINEENNRKFIETRYEYRALGYRCHLDGEDKDGVLEIKTTSQIHDRLEDYKVYLVQLLFYMMNVGKNNGILAVYERPEDFSEELDPDRLKLYKININDYNELVQEINDSVNQFKEDIERLKENPLLTEEDLLPMPIQELSKQLDIIEHKLEMYKELELEEKELKQQLYEAMEKYHIKKWETPNHNLITRIDSTPEKTIMSFNEERLKREQPMLYASYCEEKIQKGRNGSIRITIRNE